MPITVRGLVVDRVESQDQLDQTRNPEDYARYLMESMARALAERLVADGLVTVETTQNVATRAVQFRMSLKVGLPRDARSMPTDRIYLEEPTDRIYLEEPTRSVPIRPDPGVRATASGTLFAPDSGATASERSAVARIMAMRERERREYLVAQAEAQARRAMSGLDMAAVYGQLGIGAMAQRGSGITMASGTMSAPPDPPAIDPEV